MAPPADARAWDRLTTEAARAPLTFDPATIASLPGPARRLLGRALPAGSLLTNAAVVEMRGAIKFGPRWLRFEADQVLLAGSGFVWRPVVGGRALSITGSDRLVDGDARMDFRFHGIVPIVRASGPDVTRSAAGRLAGETVLWLPQALAPQSGARWRAVDGERAIVTLEVDGDAIDVEVTVAPNGQLSSIALARWNASSTPPASARFGGVVTSELLTPCGVRIAGGGCGGWGWETGDWPAGEFFRYRVTAWEPLEP